MRIRNLGLAFDAFCYSLRGHLQPETRHGIYIAAAFGLLLVGIALQTAPAPSSGPASSPVAVAPRAPARAPAERYLSAGHGTSCIDSYSNLENEVFKGLRSSSNEMLLLEQTCATQRRTLEYLAGYPRDQRDELLASLFDVAARRR